jgi:tetratricopeptide (TPR) repeat protein
MKHHYDVPISLTDEQILWYPFEYRPGLVGQRPKVPFHDRPRGMRTYLTAYAYEGNTVRVQDMMVDEIVIENRWKEPIYFSSAPYAESPLKLREHASAVGILYRLDREPMPGNFDVDKTYDLFSNTYTFTGMETPEIYRDDNATGVFLSEGSRGVSLYEELRRRGDTAKAQEIIEKIINEYPEFWQAWVVLADQVEREGDTARAMDLRWQLHDTLTAFLESNESNLVYMQDLGSTKIELGQLTGDSAMVEEGIQMLWDGYVGNKNSSYAFRKLVVALYQAGRTSELGQAVNMIAEYGRNMEDPYVQQLVSMVNRNVPTPVSP